MFSLFLSVKDTYSKSIYRKFPLHCVKQPSLSALQLVMRIPESQKGHLSEASGGQHTEAGEKCLRAPCGHRDIQSNALQNWRLHIRQRRHQQDFLSSTFKTATTCSREKNSYSGIKTSFCAQPLSCQS